MTEKELRKFALSIGLSVDMCHSKDHTLTRLLLASIEFIKF